MRRYLLTTVGPFDHIVTGIIDNPIEFMVDRFLSGKFDRKVILDAQVREVGDLLNVRGALEFALNNAVRGKR